MTSKTSSKRRQHQQFNQRLQQLRLPHLLLPLLLLPRLRPRQHLLPLLALPPLPLGQFWVRGREPSPSPPHPHLLLLVAVVHSPRPSSSKKHPQQPQPLLQPPQGAGRRPQQSQRGRWPLPNSLFLAVSRHRVRGLP